MSSRGNGFPGPPALCHHEESLWSSLIGLVNRQKDWTGVSVMIPLTRRDPSCSPVSEHFLFFGEEESTLPASECAAELGGEVGAVETRSLLVVPIRESWKVSAEHRS
jgi:hypothetical protein